MSLLRREFLSPRRLEEVSASRKHGIPIELETRAKRAAIEMMVWAGQRLRMDHIAVCTAVVLFHRYFATHSLLTNDRFLVAMACLYLGGKLEDTPKSAKDVISTFCSRRFDSAEIAPRIHDAEWMSSARDRLFLAERAVLYATRFDFVIEHPIAALLQALQQAPLLSVLADWEKAHPGAPKIQKLCFDLVNDSYKIPLCLMHPAPHIALACIWTVMKLLRLETHLLNEAGVLWWTSSGMTTSELQEIAGLLLSQVYGGIQSVQQLWDVPGTEANGHKGAAEPAEYDELFQEFLTQQ